MKTFELNDIKKLIEQYGSPLYVFDEESFINNYKNLKDTFQKIYPKYNIAYSLKTNYAPYIVSLIKELGGYAEVVSGMEYEIAKRLGFSDKDIIFNGPNKGQDGINAFINGARVHIDNIQEVNLLVEVAKRFSDRKFEVALRVNLNLGQNFISRFGIDENQLDEVFSILNKQSNISVIGLHCHISRCRDLDKWKLRTEKMLSLADKYFSIPPQYIDLGSGMYGTMDPEFKSQFENVPTYEEYANVVAGLFAKHYENYFDGQKPMLIAEPGTTLINHFVDFISEVSSIKTIQNKNFAVLNCSEHNLGETCTLKDLPIQVISCGNKQEEYANIDFTGYTCLEQDIMRKNVHCKLAVGDYVIFGNVGGYSNVLKPPFIWPNCAMVSIKSNGGTVLIKRRETYDDILGTYNFPKGASK